MAKYGWFRLDKHTLLYHMRHITTLEAKAAFLDSLAEALATETAGLNPLADQMMSERDDYRAKAAEAGRIGAMVKESLRVAKGGLATLSEPKGGLALRTDGRTDGPTDKSSDRTDGRTESVGISFDVGGKSSGDKYEQIGGIPEGKLAAWASSYCGDRDSKKGEGGFRNRLREIGPDRFRSILASFVGECESGEEPDNRGSALMARLKKAVSP